MARCRCCVPHYRYRRCFVPHQGDSVPSNRAFSCFLHQTCYCSSSTSQALHSFIHPSIHSFIHCTTHILHHPFKTVIALSGMSLNSIFECGLLCRGRRQVTVSRLGHLHTSISCSVMKFPLSSFRDRSDALSRSRRHCDFSNDPAPSSTSSRLGQSRVKKGVDSY